MSLMGGTNSAVATVPVGFYRSASVDGGYMVEGQCPWMNFVISCGTRGGQKDGAQSKLLTVMIGH